MPSWPLLKEPPPSYQLGLSNMEMWRSLGNVALLTAATWSANNLGIYTPVYSPRRTSLVAMGILNGAAVSGNLDLGIYAAGAEGKPGARLWHSGSTVQAGTTVFQRITIAGGLEVGGLFYLAASFDNTTAQVGRLAAVAAGSGFCQGAIFTEAAAFALPANATPSTAIVTANVPILLGFTL